MKTSDIAARSLRTSEVGLCWEERLTNAMGTLKVLRYSTIRVRATGATTVTIDGILAATMSSGEIMLFNVGSGNNEDTVQTVDVVIAGASAFVQVARQIDRPIS